MERIVLIACASKKGSSKAKAKDLYTSTLFKSSLSYANRINADKIYILSALHHLLDLEVEIEPYNVTLSNVSKGQRNNSLIVLSKKEKFEWGKKVVEQLGNLHDLKTDLFIFLAGKEYITPISKSLNNWENPLHGLRQGQRINFLKNN
jgi:hypothetical protein